MLRLQVTLGLFGGTDRPNKKYIVILLFSEDKYVTCKQYDYLVKSKIKKIKIIKKHNKPPFDNYYSKIQCYFRMFYIILGILEIVHALCRECVFLILVYQLSKT